MTEPGYDTSKVSVSRDTLREKKGYPPQTDTVSELIEVLEQIQDEHGDLPVRNHYIGLSIQPRVDINDRVEL